MAVKDKRVTVKIHLQNMQKLPNVASESVGKKLVVPAAAATAAAASATATTALVVRAVLALLVIVFTTSLP